MQKKIMILSVRNVVNAAKTLVINKSTLRHSDLITFTNHAKNIYKSTRQTYLYSKDY